MHRLLSPHRLVSSLLLLASFALAGCATTTEVRRIVDASNYEMLVTADPRLATTVPANPAASDAPAGALSGVDAGAAARLTAFLQANADDKVMGSTLRLREALLHLNRRDMQLAAEAFRGVVVTDLVSARDQALAAAFPDLVWWTEHSFAGEAAFRGSLKEATDTMDHLLAHARHQRLAHSADVRDHFFEMRAWIGVKLAFVVDIPEQAAMQKSMIEEAINTWADSFATHEQALVDSKTPAPDQVFSLSTRRVLRLRGVLDGIARAVNDGTAQGLARPEFRFRSGQVQSYYESRLTASR